LSPAMAEGLFCTQNWLRPSFTSFKNLDLDEEYEVSEDVIAGTFLLLNFFYYSCL